MEQSKEQVYSVGELAKKAGVTVRTLQYYDRTGLLKATVSESGRRMYTRGDILKLQQILFLKSFGFSLEEISEKLLKTKSSADLEKVFVQQREMLAAQIGYLKEIVDTLDTVIPEIRMGGEISLDKLMTIIELMKQGNPYTFVLRYFGDDQLKNVADRFDSKEKYEHIMNQSKEVFAQLNVLFHRGTDPAGKEGQELAKQWWDMVSAFTDGDPDLLKPLLSAGRDVNNWPEETKGLQDAIRNFLGAALDIYLKKIGIHLPYQEG